MFFFIFLFWYLLFLLFRINSVYFDCGVQERTDIKAFESHGSYYGLTAQLKMASDRTKV